ncbi:MAG: hypothetical protein Q4D78_10245, partial [Neisseria zoodegmatis]|nr:hypothetical protein [Neisseria zoodegmatis]
MKNDTRNRICYCIAARSVRVAVLACFSFNATLTPIAAWADVPTPPPAYHKPIDTSFPSGKALERQGYDPKTGVWKVKVNKDGRPKVTSNGSTVTGTQNVRITATDAYGNKATIGGRITQTANTAIIGAYVGGALSQGLEKYGGQAVDDIRDGRYSDAVRSTAGGAATVINAFSGGVFGSVYKVADKALGTNLMGSNPSANSSAAADSVVGNVMGAIGKGGSPSSQSSALSSAANAAASAQSAAEKSGD